jgi:hypothetical protein
MSGAESNALPIRVDVGGSVSRGGSATATVNISIDELANLLNDLRAVVKEPREDLVKRIELIILENKELRHDLAVLEQNAKESFLEWRDQRFNELDKSFNKIKATRKETEKRDRQALQSQRDAAELHIKAALADLKAAQDASAAHVGRVEELETENERMVLQCRTLDQVIERLSDEIREQGRTIRNYEERPALALQQEIQIIEISPCEREIHLVSEISRLEINMQPLKTVMDTCESKKADCLKGMQMFADSEHMKEILAEGLKKAEEEHAEALKKYNEKSEPIGMYRTELDALIGDRKRRESENSLSSVTSYASSNSRTAASTAPTELTRCSSCSKILTGSDAP